MSYLPKHAGVIFYRPCMYCTFPLQQFLVHQTLFKLCNFRNTTLCYRERKTLSNQIRHEVTKSIKPLATFLLIELVPPVFIQGNLIKMYKTPMEESAVENFFRRLHNILDFRVNREN